LGERGFFRQNADLYFFAEGLIFCRIAVLHKVFPAFFYILAKDFCTYFPIFCILRICENMF